MGRKALDLLLLCKLYSRVGHTYNAHLLGMCFLAARLYFGILSCYGCILPNQWSVRLNYSGSAAELQCTVGNGHEVGWGRALMRCPIINKNSSSRMHLVAYLRQHTQRNLTKANAAPRSHPRLGAGSARERRYVARKRHSAAAKAQAPRGRTRKRDAAVRPTIPDERGSAAPATRFSGEATGCPYHCLRRWRRWYFR